MARRKAHCSQCAKGNVCASERRALASLQAARTTAIRVRQNYLRQEQIKAVTPEVWEAAHKMNADFDARMNAYSTRDAIKDDKRERGHTTHRTRAAEPKGFPTAPAPEKPLYTYARGVARVALDPETGSERYARVTANSRTPLLERATDNAMTVTRVLDSSARPVKVAVIKTDAGPIMTPFSRQDAPEVVKPKLTKSQLHRARRNARKAFVGKFVGNAVLVQNGLEASPLAPVNGRTFHGVPGCKCDAHTLRVNMALPREAVGPCKPDCRSACKCDKPCKSTCGRKCSRKACAKNDCHSECADFCHVTPREQNEKEDEIPEVDNFTCPGCSLEFSTAYVADGLDTCKACAGIDMPEAPRLYLWAQAETDETGKAALASEHAPRRVMNEAGDYVGSIVKASNGRWCVGRDSQFWGSFATFDAAMAEISHRS